MKERNRLLRMAFVLAISLCLCSTVIAFSGESAAVRVLLDFLLRKDLQRIGDATVNYLMDQNRQDFIRIMLISPDPRSPEIMTITRYMITIMGPILIFATLFCGVYLIFFAGSPAARSMIKNMLPGIMIAMVLVMLSPYIMNVILYVSSAITLGIVTQGAPNAMMVLLPATDSQNPIFYFMTKFGNITWYSAEASAPFMFLAILLLGSLLVVVVARYLVVGLFIIIFPFTIFLYLFLPSREIGRRLMEQTIKWIFLQAVEAVAALCVVTMITALTPYLIEDVLVFLKLVGLLALVVVPVATVWFFRDFLPA